MNDATHQSYVPLALLHLALYPGKTPASIRDPAYIRDPASIRGNMVAYIELNLMKLEPSLMPSKSCAGNSADIFYSFHNLHGASDFRS